MQALPIDIPNLSSGKLPKSPLEASAGRLVCTLLLRAESPDGKPIEPIARILRQKYAGTLWGVLGLYWYFLSTEQHTKTAICEQIIRGRFMEMDPAQSHFYRQCMPWLKKVQVQLDLPLPYTDAGIESPPFLREGHADKDKPAAELRQVGTRPIASPKTVYVCKPTDFKKVIEAEKESENRAQMELLMPITQAKSLEKVAAGAIAEIELLKAEQPNMAEALDIIMAELRARLLADAPAKMPALLLCGSPGMGKTRLTSEIARIMRLPYREISLAGSSDAFKITGLSRYWRSAGCGLIARTFCENDQANPIFIFDEIEKAGNSENGSPHDAILALLEERTAKAFRDEFILAPIDVSHASFLATANSINTLPEPLLSRFIVIELPELALEDRTKITHSIYRQLRVTEPYGHFCAEVLDGDIVETMARDEKLSPRLIRRQLKLAMQRACMAMDAAPPSGSIVVKMAHLPESAIRIKGRLGFVT